MYRYRVYARIERLEGEVNDVWGYCDGYWVFERFAEAEVEAKNIDEAMSLAYDIMKPEDDHIHSCDIYSVTEYDEECDMFFPAYDAPPY